MAELADVVHTKDLKEKENEAICAVEALGGMVDRVRFRNDDLTEALRRIATQNTPGDSTAEQFALDVLEGRWP